MMMVRDWVKNLPTGTSELRQYSLILFFTYYFVGDTVYGNYGGRDWF